MTETYEDYAEWPWPQYTPSDDEILRVAYGAHLAGIRDPKVAIGGTHWQPTHWIDREPNVSQPIKEPSISNEIKLRTGALWSQNGL